MRKTFDKKELDAALSQIADHLQRRMTCHLIGGCAMTFRGQKLATKDIDLVLLGSKNFEDLIEAMEAAGFSGVPNPGGEYQELGARTIMESPGGMRFDLFGQVICRKLSFSQQMRERSTDEVTFGHLTVRLASAEDIFLFKGVTDRPDDLDDMSILAVGGLNWNIIKEECLSQESGRNWASHLVGKLEDLEESFDIVAPITSDLREWAEVFAMEAAVSSFLKGRAKSFEVIRDHLQSMYDCTEEEAAEELARLVEHQVLLVQTKGETRYYREKK